MNIVIYRMPDEISGGAIRACFSLAVNGIHILQASTIHSFSTVSPDVEAPDDLVVVGQSLELALHCSIQYRDRRVKPKVVDLRGVPIRLIS